MKKNKRLKLKNCFLAILLIGLVYSIFQFHSKDEKNQVTNQILNDTNLIFYKIIEQEDNIEFNSEYLDFFSLLDKPSVYSQLIFSQMKEFIHYKSKNTLENRNNEKDNAIFYYSFSEPILSSNSDRAIIQITEHCEMLCGECSVYIFEKVNGKWKIKEKILIWIS